MIGTWVAWMRKHLAPPPPTKLTPAERVLAVLADAGDNGATLDQLDSETGLDRSAIFQALMDLEATNRIVGAWNDDFMPRRRIYRRRISSSL